VVILAGVLGHQVVTVFVFEHQETSGTTSWTCSFMLEAELHSSVHCCAIAAYVEVENSGGS
jgi:hypothetical protein